MDLGMSSSRCTAWELCSSNRIRMALCHGAIAAMLCLSARTGLAQERIADGWFAHNSVVVMLGGADHIVVTVASSRSFPWMYRVAPALKRAVSVAGSTLNVEELKRRQVDLVFVPKNYQAMEALQRSGLHVVPVGFEDFPSLLESVDETARLLGTPLAAQRSQAYRNYLEQTLATVKAATAKVPSTKRPRVLHILSLDPLVVDGEDTIIDQWIKAAGGRNAAVGMKGVKRQVSVEQVLAWQPDVLILAASAGDIIDSRQKDLLETLSAVRQHHVYRNPAGVFP